MQFNALVVIIICLIAIAYRNLTAGLLSLAGILLAAALFYYFSPSDAPGHKSNPLLNDVELGQTEISRGYADGFVLETRIRNNNREQVLQYFTIQSSLLDCNTDQSQCLVIGEEKNVVKLRIPPGQARDALINLRTKQLNPLQGKAVWKHQITGVK
jgi:hypothetical protein